MFSMKKFINQSEEIPQTPETHLKNNLDGMSLIEALIIFTLRHSYGEINNIIKPIDFGKNQKSKILPKIAQNTAKIIECLLIGSEIDLKILHPKSNCLSLDELKILKLAFLIQNEKYFAAIYEAESWIRPTTARIMCEALGKITIYARMEGMVIPHRDFYETSIHNHLLN
jgi:hypothetical protein